MRCYKYLQNINTFIEEYFEYHITLIFTCGISHKGLSFGSGSSSKTSSIAPDIHLLFNAFTKSFSAIIDPLPILINTALLSENTKNIFQFFLKTCLMTSGLFSATICKDWTNYCIPVVNKFTID